MILTIPSHLIETILFVGEFRSSAVLDHPSRPHYNQQVLFRAVLSLSDSVSFREGCGSVNDRLMLYYPRYRQTCRVEMHTEMMEMKLRSDQASLKQRRTTHEMWHTTEPRAYCFGLRGCDRPALNMKAALRQITSCGIASGRNQPLRIRANDTQNRMGFVGVSLQRSVLT